jgi:NitT/TauT family transport system substrate-binding protein
MTKRLLGAMLAAAIAGATSADAQSIKFAELGIVADGPVYIAIEKGYFREAGIDVTLERFNSAAQATAPLSTNQVQVSGGATSAALFNAFARGWSVRIALGRTGDRPGFSSDTLSVRNDLRDSVKTLQDLKGRKIAINAPAAGLQYMVGKMLESAGLTIRDVEVVYMPWPNMGPAFDTKAIDAGALVEPFAAQYAERGVDRLRMPNAASPSPSSAPPTSSRRRRSRCRSSSTIATGPAGMPIRRTPSRSATCGAHATTMMR